MNWIYSQFHGWTFGLYLLIRLFISHCFVSHKQRRSVFVSSFYVLLNVLPWNWEQTSTLPKRRTLMTLVIFVHYEVLWFCTKFFFSYQQNKINKKINIKSTLAACWKVRRLMWNILQQGIFLFSWKAVLCSENAMGLFIAFSK